VKKKPSPLPKLPHHTSGRNLDESSLRNHDKIHKPFADMSSSSSTLTDNPSTDDPPALTKMRLIRKRKPINISISEEARQAGERLIEQQHYRSMSDLFERLIFDAADRAQSSSNKSLHELGDVDIAAVYAAIRQLAMLGGHPQQPFGRKRT
jgi:hypothetical protein